MEEAMSTFLKFLGVSCCCLVLGSVTVEAGELRLADADLDRVVAGNDFPSFPPLLTDVPGAGDFDLFEGPLNPPPPPPPPPVDPPSNGGPLPGVGDIDGLIQSLLQLIARGSLR
jgi:hypothetical protein